MAHAIRWIQLSGVHTLEELEILGERVSFWALSIDSTECWERPGLLVRSCPSSKMCCSALWRKLVLGESTVTATRNEILRYRFLAGVHGQLFTSVTRIDTGFKSFVKPSVCSSAAAASRLLHQLESPLKGPLVGWDTCGACRLGDTLYTRLKTCQNDLSDGPCGAT